MNDVKRRFFEKVQQPAHGSACWPWMAAKSTQGYGHFFYRGAVQKAHRAAWMLFRGEIPDGLVVCHACDNPSCVNPDHLWLGTMLDNNRDKVQKGRHTWGNKTHCIRNHPLSGENLYLNPQGLRECRECKRMRERAAFLKKNPAHKPRAPRSDIGRRRVA